MSSGRWRKRPPPATTFSSCMPRPMPSDGHPALLDHLAEQAIGQLAALGHDRDGRMRRQAHLARVQVVAAGQHHAVQPIEDRREVGFPDQRRNDHRQRVGGQEALEVAAVHVAVRRPALGRRAVVRVDPDQRTILHGSHPFLEMVSAKPVGLQHP